MRVDQFVGSSGSHPLTSSTTGALCGTLTKLTYAVSTAATNVSVAIQGMVNARGESLGFDNIMIRGEDATTHSDARARHRLPWLYRHGWPGADTPPPTTPALISNAPRTTDRAPLS